MPRRRNRSAVFRVSIVVFALIALLAAGVALMVRHRGDRERPPEVNCQVWAEATDPAIEGDPIWIVFEITNRSERTVTFEAGSIPLRDFITPAGAGSRLTESFFDIQCFDKPVAYLGRRDGTETPPPLTLAPGQAVHFRMDLEPNYEMFEEGIYEIRIAGTATFRDDDGNNIPVTFQTAPVIVIVEAKP
jgi:hypothetical protein